MMGCVSCLSAVTLINFYFPIPCISVHGSTHSRFSQAFHGFIHARDYVQVAYIDGIQFPVNDAEVKGAVGLRDRYDRGIPSSNRRLYNFMGDRSVNFRGGELSRCLSCLV